MVAASFDAVTASLDAAMVIVTTSVGDERAGCLVGFHAQCSIDPRRYAVWLSKANHTYRVALRSDAVGVHFLERDDFDLAELFGTRSGDDVDKFQLVEWDDGPLGVPLLRRCSHRMAGPKVALLDEGSDHVCVTVDPEAATSGRFEPLRLSDVQDLVPGHAAEERPNPPTERA